MQVNEKVTLTHLVCKDIICNKCGESCRSSEGDYEGLFGVDVIGGYYSKHIGDMGQVQFDLCEKCLCEFCDTFKISPYLLEKEE